MYPFAPRLITLAIAVSAAAPFALTRPIVAGIQSAPHDFGTWLTRTIAEYEEWLGRIEPPKL